MVSCVRLDSTVCNVPGCAIRTTALWAVAAVVVWQAVGFYMVLFIAGMQTIPASL